MVGVSAHRFAKTNDRDEEPVQLDTDLSNMIVIDGLPKASVEKFEKLATLIRNYFSHYGEIVTDYIPIDEDNKKTLGTGFIEYSSSKEASIAARKANGHQLDKRHTFRVNVYNDIKTLLEYSEDYEAPEKSEFQQQDNLENWLLDDKSRDQFVLRFKGETEVYWHEPLLNTSMELSYHGERQKEDGKNWTESYVAWSPKGRYLATYHRQGIMCWGGDDFRELGRFGHPDVKLAQFSPCERYLITFNGMEAVSASDPECLMVHDIRSGKKIIGFEGGFSIMDKKKWPIFKWSFDGSYVARLGKDCIFVYETPSMKPAVKKIHAPRIAEFSWSPSQNYISYWAPEHGDTPASVCLLSLPSAEPVREKRLYNVVDVQMFWQEAGDFLCIKVDRRRSGSRHKVTSTNFEIFRMCEKNIPIDVLEFTDPIVAFAWEPRGNRFAIVHGKGVAQKYNVSFYSAKKTKIKLEITLEPRLVNSLFWSPVGSFIILAGLGQLNGVLEFFDVNRKQTIVTQEHFMCTDVEWCPSGNYVGTAVTQPIESEEAWRYSMENGYNIWSFQGQPLLHVPTETFYQFIWRPRPPSLLTNKSKTAIRKSLREKYYKQFEDADEIVRQSQESVETRQRNEGQQWYKDFLALSKQAWMDAAPLRRELRGGYATDDENLFDVIQVEKEVEISSVEVVLGV